MIYKFDLASEVEFITAFGDIFVSIVEVRLHILSSDALICVSLSITTLLCGLVATVTRHRIFVVFHKQVLNKSENALKGFSV